MDRERAIEQLPETHAAAIRLRARGFDDSAIAQALSLRVEAVPAVLEIADGKLGDLLACEAPAPPAADERRPRSGHADAKGRKP
jgi:hypothetical protein